MSQNHLAVALICGATALYAGASLASHHEGGSNDGTPMPEMKYGKNHDGHKMREGGMEGRMHGGMGMHKGDHKAHARHVDANRDGIITADELMAHHERERRERMNHHLMKADSNGDGKVSVDEFATMHANKGDECKDGKCPKHKGAMHEHE